MADPAAAAAPAAAVVLRHRRRSRRQAEQRLRLRRRRYLRRLRHFGSRSEKDARWKVNYLMFKPCEMKEDRREEEGSEDCSINYNI